MEKPVPVAGFTRAGTGTGWERDTRGLPVPLPNHISVLTQKSKINFHELQIHMFYFPLIHAPKGKYHKD